MDAQKNLCFIKKDFKFKTLAYRFSIILKIIELEFHNG